MLSKGIWKNFDYWLFGSVIFLEVFGIIMIQSAIANNPELATAPSRQTVFLGISVVVIIIAALIDYNYWAGFVRFLYIFSFAVLAILLIIGSARFGSARWIETELFSIQPAEIVQIIMIIVMAYYFSKTKDDVHGWMWIGKSFLLITGVAIWILLQPKLSTTIVLYVLWFAMIWLSGLPSKYIITFILAAVVLVVAMFPLLEDYQQQRVINFVFPDPDARYGETYNVDQALITIGSGGLLGQGYGQGTQVQLRFLKVRHTDFIFASIAEEFGFVGTILIIALMVFVVFRCVRAGRQAKDMFGQLIAYGVATLLFFQMAVNIGVNLRLIPVTGLTLPFISYGGSSLISLSIGIGLVESVAARRKVIL